jgi:hypothetical protein
MGSPELMLKVPRDEKESIMKLLEMLQPVAEEHEIIKNLEEINSVEEEQFVPSMGYGSACPHNNQSPNCTRPSSST